MKKKKTGQRKEKISIFFLSCNLREERGKKIIYTKGAENKERKGKESERRERERESERKPNSRPYIL